MSDGVDERRRGLGGGVAWILASGCAMAAQDVVMKLLSGALPLWQILALRSAASLVALVAAAAAAGALERLPPRPLGAGLLRAAALIAANLMVFAVMPILPLSTIVAVAYTAPIFIAIGGALVFAERFGAREAAAVALGFLGVFVLTQPGAGAFTSASLIPLGAAICLAAAALLARGALRAARPAAMLFALHLGFFTASVGFGAALTLGGWSVAPQAEPGPIDFLLGAWRAPTGAQIGLLALLTIATNATQAALMRAYQLGPAPKVAAFDYAYLIFVAALAWLILGETPSAGGALGICLIVLAGLIATFRIARGGVVNRRSSRLARPE